MGLPYAVAILRPRSAITDIIHSCSYFHQILRLIQAKLNAQFDLAMQNYIHEEIIVSKF